MFRIIATGGYGQVWLASNAIGTLRAIKIVRRDEHASADSFDREFKGLQKFEPVSRSHEGLVDILTLGTLPDGVGFYYVMELADNASGPAVKTIHPSTEFSNGELGAYEPRTLRAELKARGALPAGDVVVLGVKLAASLAHLHEQGLVHRDMKPSNVLFIDCEPKLADAGLVAAVDDARSLVGTAGYIAPEGPGSPQADLYALGKVLYEAAFGKDRQDFPALPHDVASRSDHRQLLELNEILAKACAHDPKKRYAGAKEMLADLEYLGEGRSVKRQQARRRLYRSGLRLGLATLLITLSLSLLSHFTHFKGAYDQWPDREVNNLVDQGFYAWREGTPERLRHADECFQAALRRATNYVPALYGLATVHLHDGGQFGEIAKKLHRVAPDSAEAWQCVALEEWFHGQFRQALADMKEATRKRPACQEGHAWAFGGYGYVLQNIGDADGALRQYQQAVKITATDPTILDHLGHSYYMRGRFAEALQYYQASIDFIPNHLNGLTWKARALEEMERFDEATRVFETRDLLAEEDPGKTKAFYAELRAAFHQTGAQGYWRKKLEAAQRQSSPDLYEIATLQARLRQWDQAYANLRKAFQKDPFAGELLIDVCWDHADERFKRIARAVGLTW